jgi:hypothetical protein
VGARLTKPVDTGVSVYSLVGIAAEFRERVIRNCQQRGGAIAAEFTMCRSVKFMGK